MSSLDNIKLKLKRKSAYVTAFMNSDIGKEIIKLLEDEFYNGELFDKDPCQTAYNLGRRDVVMYIRELRDWSEND